MSWQSGYPSILPKVVAAELIQGAFEFPIRLVQLVFSIMITKICW